MFHRDDRHTGVIIETAGRFLPNVPLVRWDFQVSSPTAPVDNPRVVVAGHGKVVPPDSPSGNVGACEAQWLAGGIVALDWQGHLAWGHDFAGEEGNNRGSLAVADRNGGRVLNVLLPVGCYGALKAYNGLNGSLE